MKGARSKAWKLLIPVFLSLLFLPSVLADFSDGFDTYTNGATSPGPWTQSSDLSSVTTPTFSACFGNSHVDTVPGTALSKPNVYGLAVSNVAGCFSSAHFVTITLSVNATDSVIHFSFNYLQAVDPGAGSSSDIQVSVCGGGMTTVDTHSIPSTWTPESISNIATIGSSCAIVITLNTVSGGPADVALIYFDNFVIKGGNAVIAGANLFLVNYPPQQLFNISDYSGSSLRINYDLATNCAHWDMIQASPNVCLLNNLQVPDLNVSLSGAILITVNVGGAIGCGPTVPCAPYTRTIIPQPNLLHTGTAPTETMYLDIPSACPGICSYQLTVNDFTGFYPTGTTEGFITQGNFTITSALLDAQSAIAMTMVPGLYNLTLISAGGLHTFSSPLTLTATDSAPQVLIQNGSSPITIGPFQQFSYSASWDCSLGGITSTIQDSLGTMTTEVFQLYRYNSSDPGGVVVASHTSHVSGAPGFTVSYDFTNSTYGVRNINSSTPNEYKVAYTLTVPSGMENFGQFAVGTSASCPNLPNGGGLGSGFVLPTSVLGLNALLAPANAYEFIFSLIIVIMTVGIMGARMGHMAMLVMGGEVGILSILHWLPPAAVALAPIFLFMGALGVLSNRARRPIT
jgi:hypothetical protein